MKLSYSAISKYQECPFKYKLHYIDRIRTTQISSALIFGSAFDTAANSILESFGTKVDYEKVFANQFATLLESDDDIKFTKGDCDLSLLDEEYIHYLARLGGLSLLEVIDSKRTTLVEQGIFDLIATASLKAKGILLLKHFHDWAYDNIASVNQVQKKIEFANDEGDTFEGFLDFECTLKDGRKVIMDLKTSSNPTRYYPDDSAEKSPQLTIYSHSLENANVGYIVMDKTIRKKDPRVRFKEVYGVITEDQVAAVFNGIDETLHNIRNEEFPQNNNSCNNFGGCEYKKYCFSNCENMEGLCLKNTKPVKAD